jgi:two-component system LytT family response regulator
MKKIRALIVDDERICRSAVAGLLREDPEVEIAGEARNGFEAVAGITTLRPDLVFLDIQMPEMDGFEVLRALAPEETPHIVFITAYDQYAVKAFEVNALDYLLKPYSDERFRLALTRAKTGSAQPAVSAQNVDGVLMSMPAAHRFVVRTGSKVRFIAVEDVDWIEAAQNYVCLHAGKETGLLRQTMNTLEMSLRPAGFVRIHRRVLVNSERIREISGLGDGEYEILVGDRILKSSRHYRRTVSSIVRDSA